MNHMMTAGPNMKNHLNIDLMAIKGILKRRTSIFLSFSVLVLCMLAANPAKAVDDDCGASTRLVGHYKGFLDLSVIGIQRLEEFQVLLNQGGTAVIVVDELAIEAESSALGTWKRVGPQMVKVGVIQFRAGELLCARISESDGGRNDNVCTAKIALEAMVDTKGNMTGKVVVEVVEFNERRFPNPESVPTPVPLVDVRRISLDDFTFPSHQKHTK